MKFTVEVKEAPESWINLKNTKPPIAVFTIPKIIQKNMLWTDGSKINGFSRYNTSGIKIVHEKKVEPDRINKGLNFFIVLAYTVAIAKLKAPKIIARWEAKFIFWLCY